MEKWTYTKYNKPYLDIERVEILNNKLLIKSSVGNFDIEISNDKCKLSEIKSVLDDLCDPHHSSWEKIKAGQNEIISHLLTMLDEQSLIMNKDDVESLIVDQLKEVEYQVDEAIK